MTNTNRTPKTKRPRGRRGQSLVEFSLSFVVFFLLVIGLFEFGRVSWARFTLQHAAKEGSRFAMMHGSKNPIPGDPVDGESQTEIAIKNLVKSQAIGLTKSELQISVTYTPDNKPGSSVEVNVAYPFNMVFFGSSIGNIRGRSAMPIMN